MEMYLLDNNLYVISNALLLVLILLQNYRSVRKLRELAIENISIKNDLNALCRGATNVDRQLELFGSQLERVTERQERQERLDRSDLVHKEYDHAIRAIKGGASIERLINIHGLSQPEARLLVSLHREEGEAGYHPRVLD